MQGLAYFLALMLVGTSISYLHDAGPCTSNHLPPVLIILNISVILHQDQLRAFCSLSMHYQLLLLASALLTATGTDPYILGLVKNGGSNY